MRDWRDLAVTLARHMAEAFDIVPPVPEDRCDHPALAWRRAGLMAVTGRPEGPALVAPAALTVSADTALAMLRQASGAASLPMSGALLLGERARLLKLGRQGAISANGTCRLLATREGAVALNLPRGDDWELVPALMQRPVADWQALTAAVASEKRDALVERGRLLGLAIAPDRPPAAGAQPFIVTTPGQRESRDHPPLVVDLSALWAGPLAGSLLAAAGARVVKIESSRRPDGARQGHAGFFALLNGMKEQRTLDFGDPAGLAALRALVRAADIVIEASRPRALRLFGIDAEAEVARGATWLSITAHGREGGAGEAIGFGDDAAVAGGLSWRMREAYGDTLFAGDAIADPLTGIFAALAGWTSWRAGGGRLVSIAMADMVAFACSFGVRDAAEAQQWQDMAEKDEAPLYPLRTPSGG